MVDDTSGILKFSLNEKTSSFQRGSHRGNIPSSNYFYYLLCVPKLCQVILKGK